MSFRVLIVGGTGQVGSEAVRALAAEPSCAEVVMITRKAQSQALQERVREVVLDTSGPQFEAEVTKLAQAMVALGDRVVGASCIGVGAGSNQWTEEQLKALELGVVGAFARGCRGAGVAHFGLLTAVGSNAKSLFRYIRVMGLKEELVEGVGFARLAIFQPGIIGGNVHTPGVVAALGRIIPGRYGTVEQDEIGRAFAAEFVKNAEAKGVARFDNGAMRRLLS